MKKLAALLPVIIALGAPAAQAAGDPTAGQAKSAVCGGCHGVDGNSANPQWPRLAGQHESYLAAQLAHFKAGERKNALMSPMAANLSDQDMLDLAAYFGSQTPQVGAAREDLVELGAKIYRGGNAGSGVPACMGCHGPAGAGNGPTGYPSVSGQHAVYTAQTLADYASGARGGGKAEIMQTIAARLSKAEIEAVASFISGLH